MQAHISYKDVGMDKQISSVCFCFAVFCSDKPFLMKHLADVKSPEAVFQKGPHNMYLAFPLRSGTRAFSRRSRR